MVFFARLKFLTAVTKVNSQVGYLKKCTFWSPKSTCILSFFLINNSSSENKISIKPSMPKSSTIKRYTALINPLVGEFRDRIYFKARTICMSSNDFESCIVRIKLFSNIESDNSSKISGEEIFVSGLKSPVINLV